MRNTGKYWKRSSRHRREYPESASRPQRIDTWTNCTRACHDLTPTPRSFLESSFYSNKRAASLLPAAYLRCFGNLHDTIDVTSASPPSGRMKLSGLTGCPDTGSAGRDNMPRKQSMKPSHHPNASAQANAIINTMITKSRPIIEMELGDPTSSISRPPTSRPLWAHVPTAAVEAERCGF